jgi:hypothetical protein
LPFLRRSPRRLSVVAAIRPGSVDDRRGDRAVAPPDAERRWSGIGTGWRDSLTYTNPIWHGRRWKDDVLRDEHVDGEAGTDRDGGLEGQVLLGDLLARLVDLGSGVGRPDLREAWLEPLEVALAAGGGGSEEAAEGNAGEDAPPVVVNLISETGVAGEARALVKASVRSRRC